MGIQMMEMGRSSGAPAAGIRLRGRREWTGGAGHSGPYMHDFYDFQYCMEGGYTLYLNDRPHSISKGQLFCVPPYVKVEKDFPEGETASVFVCVRGTELKRYVDALGFSLETPVFPHALPESFGEQMGELVDLVDASRAMELQAPMAGVLRQMGLFYEMLAQLLEIRGTSQERGLGKNNRQEYVEQAIRYIESNYPFAIDVDSISAHVGLNRSYLYSLFQKELGMSVQAYLIETRMNAACDFLRRKDVQIKTVAASVGYEPVAFAHIFKKTMGISAREYRARFLESAR